MVPPGAVNSGFLNQVVYSSMGGAKRTMVKDILAAIDNEIACLEQAKALLSASGTVSAKRKPGRPAKVATVVTPKVQKTRKRGKMSAEGRERVRQAQIKRWAALKGASKANLNTMVAPLPRAKKKAAKAA
jgi:L-alanine-DL-glutamate epimerase-like enolase superfamily enzyme